MKPQLKHSTPSVLFIILLFLGQWSFGQQKTPIYSLSEAGSHIGEYATVRGVVSAVFESKKGNYFLNMGGDYPNQLFTAVIFKGSSSKFADSVAFEGKTIEVTGKIKSYQGKPEIILDLPSYIRVVR